MNQRCGGRFVSPIDIVQPGLSFYFPGAVCSSSYGLGSTVASATPPNLLSPQYRATASRASATMSYRLILRSQLLSSEQ